MRLQLALNVRNLDDAVAFYQKLFGSAPHKRRPGYANFAIVDPPLKLVLFEDPNASERLNHLGVEVAQEEELAAAIQRLDDAGLVDEIQNDTTCCHATQDKVWAREPDGIRFEWYRITDDEAVDAPRATGCCASAEVGV